MVAPKYWVNGPGQWNDTSHWALTSGGTSGETCPYPGEPYIFDENSQPSMAAAIAVLNGPELLAECVVPSLDFTSEDYTDVVIKCEGLSIFGSLILKAGMTFTTAGDFPCTLSFWENSGLVGSSYDSTPFVGTGDVGVLNTAGVSLADFTIASDLGGALSIESDVVCDKLILNRDSTLALGDSIGITILKSKDNSPDLVLYPGNGGSFTARSAEIICNMSAGFGFYNVLIGVELNNLIFRNALGTGSEVVAFYEGDNYSFHTLAFFDAPYNIQFGANTSFSCIDLIAGGEESSNFTLSSDTPGTPWGIECSTGNTINISQCTLIDSHASGGATFYSLLTNGCVDGGGNEGWIFEGEVLIASTNAHLNIQLPPIGNIQPAADEVYHAFDWPLTGRLRLDVDPLLLAPGDFQQLTNLRYTTTGTPRGVLGMTAVALISLAGITPETVSISIALTVPGVPTIVSENTANSETGATIDIALTLPAVPSIVSSTEEGAQETAGMTLTVPPVPTISSQLSIAVPAAINISLTVPNVPTIEESNT